MSAIRVRIKRQGVHLMLLVAVATAAVADAQQPTPTTPPASPAATPRPTPAQSPAAATQANPPPVATLDRIQSRLAALNPANPEEYFALAEDVLDANRTSDGQRLATRLFVLAYTLDRERGGTLSLAASCCLALAQLSPSRTERDWLRSLAVQIDPRRDTPGWVRRQPPATSEAIDYQVAVAVGLTRTGNGAFAKQLLRKPEVRDRLQQLDRMARRMGISGGASAIVTEASRWPCPTCQNQRVDRRSVSTGEPKLCSSCDGMPGTRLSRPEMVAQLRFESWLLAGTRRTWSSQVTLDMGTPLPDLDPAKLPAMLTIDATRPFFRGGKWVQTADGDIPTAPPSTQQSPSTAPPMPTKNGG